MENSVSILTKTSLNGSISLLVTELQRLEGPVCWNQIGHMVSDSIPANYKASAFRFLQLQIAVNTNRRVEGTNQPCPFHTDSPRRPLQEPTEHTIKPNQVLGHDGKSIKLYLLSLR